MDDDATESEATDVAMRYALALDAEGSLCFDLEPSRPEVLELAFTEPDEGVDPEQFPFNLEAAK